MRILLKVTLALMLLIGCSTTAPSVKRATSNENVAINKFGMEVASLGEEQKTQTGLSHGVVVTNVYSTYPANQAGILKGDIIVNLDQHTVLGHDEFVDLLKSYRFTYGEVTLAISRNNQIQKIKVYLN